MEMANGGGMMGGVGGSGSVGLNRVADNAVQVAVIVRVGRARRNEPLLRLPHRRRKRDEPRRRGKRSATARTTLLLRRESCVVVPPALAGVLVVPRFTSEPTHVACRRVVHAPEELARAALLPRRDQAAGEAVAEAGGTDMAVDVAVFVLMCFL